MHKHIDYCNAHTSNIIDFYNNHMYDSNHIYEFIDYLIKYNRLEVIKHVFENNNKLSDDHKLDFLYLSIMLGYTNLVEYICSRITNINSSDKYIPVLNLCICIVMLSEYKRNKNLDNYLEIFKILLRYNADTNKKDSQGNDPVMIITRNIEILTIYYERNVKKITIYRDMLFMLLCINIS